MDIQNLTERGARMQRLRKLIPKEKLYRKLSQDGCELKEDFLVFLNTHEVVSRFVPTNMVVVEFGCYMAAQAYFSKISSRNVGSYVSYFGVFKGGQYGAIREGCSCGAGICKTINRGQRYAVHGYFSSDLFLRKTYRTSPRRSGIARGSSRYRRSVRAGRGG